jgi:hypothetical protein
MSELRDISACRRLLHLSNGSLDFDEIEEAQYGYLCCRVLSADKIKNEISNLMSTTRFCNNLH